MHKNNFKPLDKGNNSEIFLFKEEMVLKMVDIKFKKQAKHLANEFELMSACDHPHILKVSALKKNIPIKVTSDPDQYCRRDVLIMEFANQGSLLSFLKKGQNLAIKKTLVVQLSTAFEYLHLEKGIAHRDIKLDNILVRKQADGTITALLSDFGFAIKNPNSISQEVEKEDNTSSRQEREAGNQNGEKNGSGKSNQMMQFEPFVTSSYKGTQRGYMAPQILNFKNKIQPYNPFKVDVFAFGVVLFCLFFEILPFEFASSKDPLFKLIIDQKWNEFWGKHEINELKYTNINLEELKTLLEGMLCHIPENRYSVTEVTESEFIQALMAEELLEEEQQEESAMIGTSTHNSTKTHQID